MANPVAVPGTNVPAGAGVSPGGATGLTGSTGPAGANAATTNTIAFTVPAVGNTVGITVADASWMMLNEYVYVNNAGGSGLAGAMQITAIAGNNVTLLNPAPAPAIPLASSAGAGLLAQTSNLTTDYVDGTNTCRDLTSAPAITLMRLRSFNAIGNPNFEVDQRNCGTSVAFTGGIFGPDRWKYSKVGTLTATGQQQGANVLVPNTNFCITQNFCRITLTTQQASLGATDYLIVYQQSEGPYWRELSQDVNSLTVLVRSSVTGTFGVFISDRVFNNSLCKLVTISSANTWTLVQFPNLPIWPAGGFFNLAPGTPSYQLGICLAAGTTYTASANNVWVAGNNIFGANGQSNFAASVVNSTFDIGFIQHEPGPNCTQLIDKPFSQNYYECLRYYQKSLPYGSPFPNTPWEVVGMALISNSTVRSLIRFRPQMAKAPTMSYANNSGVAGQVYVEGNTTNYNVSTSAVTDSGVWTITLASAVAASLPNGQQVLGAWAADTGW